MEGQLGKRKQPEFKDADSPYGRIVVTAWIQFCWGDDQFTEVDWLCVPEVWIPTIEKLIASQRENGKRSHALVELLRDFFLYSATTSESTRKKCYPPAQLEEFLALQSTIEGMPIDPSELDNPFLPHYHKEVCVPFYAKRSFVWYNYDYVGKCECRYEQSNFPVEYCDLHKRFTKEELVKSLQKM